MKLKQHRKQKRIQFCRSFFITLCLLGLTAGLFWADYNTRSVTDGTEDWAFFSSYSDQTLTIRVWDTTQTVSVPKEAEKALYHLRDLLPAPLRLWGMAAEELRRLFGFE